jgi:hypothetical protein
MQGILEFFAKVPWVGFLAAVSLVLMLFWPAFAGMLYGFVGKVVTFADKPSRAALAAIKQAEADKQAASQPPKV